MADCRQLNPIWPVMSPLDVAGVLLFYFFEQLRIRECPQDYLHKNLYLSLEPFPGGMEAKDKRLIYK
jgi:hypothetical protein